ncbi:hypothetical protein C8Q74DRAFT_1301640 [Fomes fomentarius]|nr:hypothetical protein C8Q74DRAFT_1301640 [Fomes fomentarius]
MSSMNSSVSSSPTVGQTDLVSKTIGAILMAGFISTMLYGLMLHQAYRYVRNYSKDTVIIKLIVLFVLITETLYTICNIHYCYHDFVSFYGTKLPLTTILWSGDILPLLGIITGTATHVFFLRRATMVGSRYRVLALLAIPFHIVQNTFGLIITIKGFVNNSPTVYIDGKRMIGLCFGFALAADLAIFGSLFGVMHEGRQAFKRNGPKKTMVEMVTIYFLNTGALVVLLDFVTLVMAMATSDNLYWAAINSVTSRVYTNTLFCVLNSRKLHAAHGIEIFSDGPLQTISRAKRLAAIERWNVPEELDPTPTKITIAVTTEREDENMSRVDSQQGSDLDDLRMNKV